MSGKFKKVAKWLALSILGATIGLVVKDVGDELLQRSGFAPRNLVPESFLRRKSVPPDVKEAQQVKEAEKKLPPARELDTGSLKGTAPLKDEVKRLARDKCQRAKTKRIGEEEARVSAVDAEWQKCLNAARWWPLLYGDAEEYCADWQRVKMGLESVLESTRGWSC